jgi:hypothetical protein
LLFGIDRLNVKADSAAKYHREERYSARHSLFLLLSVRMYIDGRREFEQVVLPAFCKR